jgi:pullulanase
MSVESEMEETVAAVKKYGKGNPNAAFEPKENIAKINKMAAGIYMTAAGIPFFQAGEEFLRTKYGEDDSYKSSAKINMLDWKRAYENKDVVEYYASLIKMRKEHKELFHMSDNDGASVEFKAVEEPKVQFVVDKKVEVVYNPSEACVEIKA